jgi:polyhydroxyalkanoate synthesis regulator phasin
LLNVKVALSSNLLCCWGDARDEDEVIEEVIEDVIEWGLTADEAGDGVEDVAPKMKKLRVQTPLL